MSTAQSNRKLNPGLVFLMGLGLGALCYLVAEWLTPKQVDNPGDHDILLADRLGFIYAPVVGLWIGWLQRSWRRAVAGAAIGALVGLAYTRLCASRNFLAIMVGFPCLLGGVMAAAASSNRSPWLAGLGGRFGKGLVAGLVLGFVYMVTLNVAGEMVMSAHDNPGDYTRGYITTMWRAGPIALGLAGGLFFILIRWAVGLTRVRILVFEDMDGPKKPENAEPGAAANGGPTAPSGNSAGSGEGRHR